MWLNQQHIAAPAIRAYRKALLHSTPHHLVIDQLFDPVKLLEVSRILQQEQGWQTQQHTYSALYVDEAKWQKTPAAQRFVQRDLWQRTAFAGSNNIDIQSAGTENVLATPTITNPALAFLQFLRGAEFMALLSRLFRVQITDIHVANPELNTNYFRLGAKDFVNQHADDSPGREVCMLLYLNEHWHDTQGGELVFSGKDDHPVYIAPLFNRCVLFDPSSEGAEHWVNPVRGESGSPYRYNLTSWYWSE
ncbi:2OG-Fe(II) oxygenase [Rheinheimera riviphila]|uniref:2OG-Fe(II) oxygenase n=1 Tax=Rheinheimera riviphila TaxID=1834037 RepID=A0A437QLL5_9GAMM|nr:2OG-Fe(II) oxygenase [Rheinheimera riviphila]RVU35372.1 2OG-Fe(II) oxygenase [Rheinheimera riviphila]